MVENTNTNASTATVNPVANNTHKYIYEWVVPFEKEVTETVEEDRGGQKVKVTQTIRKEVPVKMALKRLTRREQREADEFYGVEYNRYLKKGFSPRQVIINMLENGSGGVISEKEREEIARLIQKRIELELDLARSVDCEKSIRDDIQARLHAVSSKIMEFNAANESLFSQTAETKAQNQLQTWFAVNMVLIEKNGVYVPYYEGDNFAQREEFMLKLEEAADPFYLKAMEKIAFGINLFMRGIDKPEQFEIIEKEMKEQLESKLKNEKATSEQGNAGEPDKQTELPA